MVPMIMIQMNNGSIYGNTSAFVIYSVRKQHVKHTTLPPTRLAIMTNGNQPGMSSSVRSIVSVESVDGLSIKYVGSSAKGDGVGDDDGNTVGDDDGNTVGDDDGNTVGDVDGNTVGDDDGNTVGDRRWQHGRRRRRQHGRCLARVVRTAPHRIFHVWRRTQRLNRR